MEKSIFDLAVDELLERQRLTKIELHKRFKGVKPFRMEKVPDEERIQNYLQIDDEMEQEMRQQFGDDAMDKMHLNMRELINRRMMRNA